MYNTLIPSFFTQYISLEWVQKIKYLGFVFTLGKSLTIDFTDCKRKFFANVNTILAKAKFCNELVKLQLVENFCLPILTYANRIG